MRAAMWNGWSLVSGASRDDVEAALTGFSSIRASLDLLAADVASTLGWARKDAEAFIADTAAVIIEFLEDTAWRFDLRVIENVQQRIHDEFIDTSWPACPIHGLHPLWV